MKATKTWILIADGARARVVVNEGPGKGLRAALDHEFAASHAPSRAWGSDKPGSAGDGGKGARHAVTPKIDYHEFAKERFAQEMAGMLDSAASQGVFDRLVLVAPPKVLGNLRGAMKNGARRKVTGELAKDLTHIPLRDLPGYLESVAMV